MTFIYILIDPRNNQVRYVGKTDNIRKRYNHHLIDNYKSYKTAWIKSLKNEKLKPIMEVIDEVPLNEWVFWEKYWISQMKAWGFKLTNLSNGGEGFASGLLNPAHLPHVKELKSKHHKGKAIPQEMRDRISQTLSGRKNPEHSKKMSGRKQSEEIKQKTSIALRGTHSKINENIAKEIKKMVNGDTNKTMREIGQIFGVSKDIVKKIKYNKTWVYIVI